MEISRVNVVYFLSRNGRVEHPHLVRVHHHSRSGVRLRDVKRWLSEIRGKEMPDSFAWSYKRRYRSGYVWQDLTDDDLITPISDSEYVLKGSQILHASPSTAAMARQHCFFPFDKEKTQNVAEDAGDQKAEEQKETGTPPKISSETVEILPDDVNDLTSPKPPPATSAPGPECSSGASDESTGRKAVFKIDAFRERGGKEKVAAEVPAAGDGAGIVNSRRRDVGDGSSKSASEVLWSILTCRDNCADPDALRPIVSRRREKARSSSAGGGTTSTTGGGVSRNDDGSRKEKSKSSGMEAKRPGEKGIHPATYNPACMPNCSQCGKAFKPEKLHSHMKSCKGLRERVKKQHEQ